MFIQAVLSELLTMFAAKLGIAILHHELECHAKKLVCYFKVKVTVMTRFYQSMTVSTISTVLLNPTKCKV